MLPVFNVAFLEGNSMSFNSANTALKNPNIFFGTSFIIVVMIISIFKPFLKYRAKRIRTSANGFGDRCATTDTMALSQNSVQANNNSSKTQKAKYYLTLPSSNTTCFFNLESNFFIFSLSLLLILFLAVV